MDRQDGYHMLICFLLESVSLHKLGLEKPGGRRRSQIHTDWRCVWRVRRVRRGMVVCGCHNVQLSKSFPLLPRNSTFYQLMAAIYSEVYPAFFPN